MEETAKPNGKTNKCTFANSINI